MGLQPASITHQLPIEEILDRSRPDDQRKRRSLVKTCPFGYVEQHVLWCSRNFPRAMSWSLTILRGADKLTAGLVAAFDSEGSCLSELAADFLGPAEQAYFQHFDLFAVSEVICSGAAQQSSPCATRSTSQTSEV
jgi:hypothetical protein